MSFWGIIVKSGQKVPVESTEGDILHLSQACLNNPKGGKNYLQVTDDAKTYTIACLEKDKVEHASFDLFFSTATPCHFSVKGESECHLTGYFEPSQDMDEDDEEESIEEAPPAKKSPLAAPAKSPLAKPASPAAPSPKKSPLAAPAKSPVVQAKANAAKNIAEEEDDDDDEDDEEEDEDEEAEDEMDEEAEDEMEGEEDEEEDEEEEEEAAPPPKNNKRKAPEPAPPAKKAKGQEPPAKPAAAAGSPKAGAAGSPAVAAFVKQIQDFLKKNGKANIAMIGSKVQRPKDAPKLKVLLEQHKDKFTLNGQDVELKK